MNTNKEQVKNQKRKLTKIGIDMKNEIMLFWKIAWKDKTITLKALEYCNPIGGKMISYNRII